MCTLLLDECTYHLIKAQECYSEYQELDTFSEIFEAEDPKVKEQVDKNEKATTGALGHLKKAAQAVLNTIRNIITSITDFFRKLTMDDKERKAYDDFKAAAAKNPELKNKKITVMDFRKFNEDYEALLRETEEAERQIAQNKEYPLDQLSNKITTWCGNAGKGAVVAIGCDAALNYASSSREVAQKMLASLQNDEKVWKTLCDSIGEKEAKKFEKQIKSLGKRCSIQAIKMKLKGTASRGFEDAIQKTLASVEEIAVGGATVAKNMPVNDPSKSDTGNKLAMAKAAITHPKDTISGAVKVGKHTDIINRAMGNEAISQGVHTVVDTSNQANHAARDMWKQEHHPKKKLFNKKKSYRDQSAKDALLGKNDPNSTLNKVKKIMN